MQLVITLTEETKRKLRAQRVAFSRIRDTIEVAALRGGALLASKIGEEEFGPGKTLNVVTGNLRRSIECRIRRTDVRDVVAEVGVIKGPATAYAAIHEHGGVIKPVKGKALAIPLKEALTLGGRPKYPGGPREAERRLKGVFMLKRPGKPPLIGVNRRVAGGGSKTDFVPLFVLVPKVNVRAKHWLSGGVRKHLGIFEVEVQGDLDALLGAA